MTVAVEAVSAASAAALVQKKVEGRDRQRTVAVIRVQDEKQRIIWRNDEDAKGGPKETAITIDPHPV